MRPIKFRAWDSLMKEMITHEQLQEDQRCGPLTYAELVNSGEEVGLFLMQFTGLRDKNGKEIYEGDILRVPTRRPGHYWVCAVEYEDDGYKAKPMDDPEDDFGLVDVVDCPVIGNIYENPELLLKTS